ncbi:hypothetical protein F1559_005146 [Cyanidiococcus yangmingshanensis]|uniref:Uncharacterized protein n=1 Tax=Cyanidiococcus yangmingshanensis TaxID=2690220 RepID=A0A7J7IQY8_9RHOD|nr:hypothetical protein F1559_005146 [Cyanidiococcus yangmingshanensis]
MDPRVVELKQLEGVVAFLETSWRAPHRGHTGQGGLRTRARPSRTTARWRRQGLVKHPSLTITAGIWDGIRGVFGGQQNEANKPSAKSYREQEIEEQRRIMEEKLAARRAGRHLDGVVERRRAVQEHTDAKEKPKPGEDPLIAWERQREKERAAGTWKEVGYGEEPKQGIIFPWPSFGIPRYDYGERFDLRLPYVDEGYVDEEADVMGKLFGGRRSSRETKPDHLNSENADSNSDH